MPRLKTDDVNVRISPADIVVALDYQKKNRLQGGGSSLRHNGGSGVKL